VEAVPKPAGYEYGAVGDAGYTFLAAGMIGVCILGAVVPFVLSLGESALQQQVKDSRISGFNRYFSIEEVGLIHSECGGERIAAAGRGVCMII
jgi:hypothetical protein